MLKGKKVTLTRGVYSVLSDFQWLADDLEKIPTRLYESPQLWIYTIMHPALRVE